MDLKYQRIKVIGKGSFGKAYLVRNTEEDMLCVVKQMETSTMSAKDRTEAVKEAQFLKKMEHPNIIRFMEVFMTRKGKLCIVMEYADGGDIHSKIRERKSDPAKRLLPEDTILKWFSQTCFALHHVHERRVLHRDLKTQNIFLMDSDQVKLGDFGIARVIQCTEDFARTMVGTPYYLSPEIIKDLPYDYKSDVWACGVVLFEMASLQHPFNADQLTVLAARILQDDVPPIDTMYSQHLYLLITDMLKKTAQMRPRIRDVLSKEFLQPTMRSVNDLFSLGIDLKEFAPEKNVPLETVLSPRTTGSPRLAGSGACEESQFASDSDTEHENATAKSIAKLKLSDGVHSASPSSIEVPSDFTSKAAVLRCYLKENTSEDEFRQVYVLTREAAGKVNDDLTTAMEDARQQAKDILGPERASLLSMFQLLGFLEDVSISLLGKSSDGQLPSWESFRQKEAILSTFKKWDLNQDGVISKAELERVMTLLGVATSDIEKIFSAADTNIDGKIDYNEFVHWLYYGAAVSKLGKDLDTKKV
mmetsp:Transcript_8059/g.13164  ORF Transcript_8059/g.13164 Transcript_8059/m.13164 type:complete len:531 (-) Transcript_8059:104-1696(-)|eukprot:CAMPEP_0169327100 /NCGR_PEP_ID=MMETSP1017-20121227/11863_1 /TAXON_ID=342587 /ORGANISM="Karlodinium micrum, Strain CCMP2283" /LENGTH=530 /DNA_ID=CAMNT_0009421867 /DNA_START=33 /DNA_END=1625 /DNA_ORIENTATION=+